MSVAAAASGGGVTGPDATILSEMRRIESRPHTPSPETTNRMRSVRRHGTAAEEAVRRALWALGVRCRQNVNRLPGSPDLVSFPRKLAVFVHGCFWHSHPRCTFASVPRSNTQFWKAKLNANVLRDRRKSRELRELGYRVVVVWECQTRRGDLGQRISRLLERPR